MTALAEWSGASDAMLASAAAAGDRAAFAAIYDRYADRLHDFCVGMLRDREAAADCVQETFCTAANGLSRLREPEKLRPWLYAVSRSQALRHLSRRRREEPSEDMPDIVSGEAGPEALAGQGELAKLIADAEGGLTDRDREVLELTYRHGLDGPELAEALGVTPANANTLVHRVREMVGRSLGALLVARSVKAEPYRCPELATVLQNWDGAMTVLMRKRIARHIESCDSCEQEQRRRVSPRALLSVPLFIPAPVALRDKAIRDFQLTCATNPLDDTAGNWAPTPARGSDLATLTGVSAQELRQLEEDSIPDAAQADRNRGMLIPMGLFVAAIVLFAGLAMIYVHRLDTTVTRTVNDVQQGPVPGSSAPAAPRQTVEPTHELPSAPPTAPVAPKRSYPAISPAPPRRTPENVVTSPPAPPSDDPQPPVLPPVPPSSNRVSPVVPVIPFTPPVIPVWPPVSVPEIPKPPVAPPAVSGPTPAVLPPQQDNPPLDRGVIRGPIVREPAIPLVPVITPSSQPPAPVIH